MNFHEEYKKYTNIELLKILKRPQQYQPAAVKAAEEILDGRDVTNEDKAAADIYYSEIDTIKAIKEANIEEAKNKVQQFLAPLRNRADAKPEALARLFLILTCAVYGYRCISRLLYFARIAMYDGFVFDTTYLTMLLSCCFMITICILLFLRLKAGWVAMVLFEMLSWLTSAFNAYAFIKEEGMSDFTLDVILLWPLLLSSLLLFCLWQNPITEHYKTTPYKKTLATIVAVAVLLRIIVALINTLGGAK